MYIRLLLIPHSTKMIKEECTECTEIFQSSLDLPNLFDTPCSPNLPPDLLNYGLVYLGSFTTFPEEGGRSTTERKLY